MSQESIISGATIPSLSLNGILAVLCIKAVDSRGVVYHVVSVLSGGEYSGSVLLYRIALPFAFESLSCRLTSCSIYIFI